MTDNVQAAISLMAFEEDSRWQFQEHLESVFNFVPQQIISIIFATRKGTCCTTSFSQYTHCHKNEKQYIIDKE